MYKDGHEVESLLHQLTDEELRAEARQKNTLRELEGLRRRIDELVGGLKETS